MIKIIFNIIILFYIVNLQASDKVLNIYAWSGYLPDETIKNFEQQTGIRIHHATFLNNEVLYAKLKANPDSGYDIIMPSSYFVARMVKQQLIQPINTKSLTNFNNINPVFLNQEHDSKNQYSIPYLYTATGIAINKKYHQNINIKNLSWGSLWDPKYQDKLLIFDDTREIFGVALLKLGYSVNDTNPNHIKQAFMELNNLKNNIKLFNTEAQRTIYLDEDITIGMAWNGDLFVANLGNSMVTMLYPTEGLIVSLDCLAIPVGAKHIEYAHQFINFVLQAEVGRDIALESGFSSANLAGINLLPQDIKNNKILYPDNNVLKKSHLINDIGDAALLYEKYFELLRS